jgi:hypothetical protein
MSNIFEEVLKDAKGVEEKLLGPSYPYYKNIKTPSEIGMTDKGSISALGKDINGLIEYVNVLVTGKSKASATGGPLGNKFFLKTGAKCKDTITEEEVERYIYVNNIPQGNIPFISGGLGVNFSEFRGLIPGTMSNLNVLNPFNILQSFLSGSTPDCQELTMQTVDTNNNSSSETHFVTLVDIKNMDQCSFADKINPITKEKCKETFTNFNQEEEINFPDDPIVQLYFAGLGLVTIYVLYRIMEKANKFKKNSF